MYAKVQDKFKLDFASPLDDEGSRGVKRGILFTKASTRDLHELSPVLFTIPDKRF